MATKRAWKMLVATGLGIVFGAGCGGDCLERDTGESVLTSCVSRVQLQQAETGFPRPPDGSACSGQERYVVDLMAGTIEWSSCLDSSLSEAWTTTSGQRALTPDELADFVAALNDLTVSGDEGGCGGVDKPTRTIRLFGDDADLTYNDSFYRCRKPAPHVDQIDSAFEIAHELTAQ